VQFVFLLRITYSFSKSIYYLIRKPAGSNHPFETFFTFFSKTLKKRKLLGKEKNEENERMKERER
jgi:hypothetical protein